MLRSNWNLFVAIDFQKTYRDEQIASEFEAWYWIPLILGATDGSIFIISPPLDPIFYYFQKGFYLHFLQRVVVLKCKFWDYDFGWCSQIHDWALFQKSDIWKKTMKGSFYLLSSSVMLLIPWRLGFIHHSKVKKKGYQERKVIGVLLNQVFEWLWKGPLGSLKGRWHILFKKIDMPFWNVPDIVTTSLCLHNFCILEDDKFDMAKVAKMNYK
jgi:hypothetical protein